MRMTLFSLTACFLLSLCSCQTGLNSAHRFYIVQAGKGFFLSDYVENSGLLILSDLDPEVRFVTKSGKRESGKLTIKQFVDELKAHQSHDVGFVFYRDQNNDRVNLPITADIVEYLAEKQELRVHVTFGDSSLQIKEITMHRVVLFVS